MAFGSTAARSVKKSDHEKSVMFINEVGLLIGNVA